MARESRILGDVVDDDRAVALSDLVADGGLEWQFSARQQAELNIIPDGAANPAVFRDATAANPIPVVLQMTSKILGTASIR
jgi:hypothetical protein